VRHFVEECVGAFCSIPREHEVNVQRDLGHPTIFVLRNTRHHMAEG
jgi:hypothetical protein